MLETKTSITRAVAVGVLYFAMSLFLFSCTVNLYTCPRVDDESIEWEEYITQPNDSIR